MQKVSVILTTYNSGAMLERTLTSILTQEGAGQDFELEVIAVDDCSTDDTQHILRLCGIDFLSTGTNSKGPNKGRNIGLANCTGDYICFIDHDDLWHPQKIRQQLQVAASYPIVSAGYQLVDHAHNQRIDRFEATNKVYSYQKNETFLRKLQRETSGQKGYLSTLMIHKSLKNIFFEEHFGMVDFDWQLRLYENRTSAEIASCLMTRHLSARNLSLANDYRKKDYYYSLFTMENYRDAYPREVSRGIRHLNGSRARYFYLVNNMRDARRHFFKSAFGMKELAFLLTSYAGSNFIRKNFHFFG